MLNRQTFLFKAAIIAAFSLTALAACQNKAEKTTMDNTNQPDKTAATFANQAATGKFMDAPFTFAAGKATEHPFESSKFEFILFGETPKVDICSGSTFDLPRKSIIFATPKAVGTYPITQKDAISFNNAETNNNSTAMVANGSIEIVSISPTAIVGKINTASSDGKNTLNGNFTVNICK
jgi:hypothetical protein